VASIELALLVETRRDPVGRVLAVRHERRDGLSVQIYISDNWLAVGQRNYSAITGATNLSARYCRTPQSGTSQYFLGNGLGIWPRIPVSTSFSSDLACPLRRRHRIGSTFGSGPSCPVGGLRRRRGCCVCRHLHCMAIATALDAPLEMNSLLSTTKSPTHSVSF
jgi:hypothetical protein